MRRSALLRAPVSHIMRTNPACVPEDVSEEQLVSLLLDQELGGLPVVARDGTLVGWVSALDVLRDRHDDGDAGEHYPLHVMTRGFHEVDPPPAVRAVMHPVAMEVLASTTVARAMRLMVVHRMHRLPVVDEDAHLVGVLESRDVMRLLLEEPRPPAHDAAMRQPA